MDFYEKNAKHYFEETISLPMQEVYECFLPLLSADAHILDLGCGSGRDALYFLQQGYKVTAVDGSKRLAALASVALGQQVLVQNFTTLNLPKKYHAVWASASLLHLHKAQLPSVLASIKSCLVEGGIFYLSLKTKKDIDEGIDSKGRFFAYYDLDEIITMLAGIGFTKVKSWTTEKSLRGDIQSWCNVVVRK